MSICSYWIWKDIAIVAVDTVCTHSHLGVGTMSKMVSLPHANVLLAHRGITKLAAAAYLRISTTMKLDSFDKIDADLPAIFEDIDAFVRDNPDVLDLDSGLELFLFGWSDRLGRMAGSVYTYAPGKIDGGFRYTPADDNGCDIVPSSDEMFAEGCQLPNTHDGDAFELAMMDLCRRQVAYGNEIKNGIYFGGELLVAHLCRGSVTIRNLGSIG